MITFGSYGCPFARSRSTWTVDCNAWTPASVRLDKINLISLTGLNCFRLCSSSPWIVLLSIWSSFNSPMFFWTPLEWFERKLGNYVSDEWWVRNYLNLVPMYEMLSKYLFIIFRNFKEISMKCVLCVTDFYGYVMTFDYSGILIFIIWFWHLSNIYFFSLKKNENF